MRKLTRMLDDRWSTIALRRNACTWSLSTILVARCATSRAWTCTGEARNLFTHARMDVTHPQHPMNNTLSRCPHHAHPCRQFSKSMACSLEKARSSHTSCRRKAGLYPASSSCSSALSCSAAAGCSCCHDWSGSRKYSTCDQWSVREVMRRTATADTAWLHDHTPQKTACREWGSTTRRGWCARSQAGRTGLRIRPEQW